MTLTDIEVVSSETLTPDQVAPILRCRPQMIRLQARQRPEALGFPVIVVGTRVKIPKQAFLAYMRGLHRMTNVTPSPAQ